MKQPYPSVVSVYPSRNDCDFNPFTAVPTRRLLRFVRAQTCQYPKRHPIARHTSQELECNCISSLSYSAPFSPWPLRHGRGGGRPGKVAPGHLAWTARTTSRQQTILHFILKVNGRLQCVPPLHQLLLHANLRHGAFHCGLHKCKLCFWGPYFVLALLFLLRGGQSRVFGLFLFPLISLVGESRSRPIHSVTIHLIQT